MHLDNKMNHAETLKQIEKHDLKELFLSGIYISKKYWYCKMHKYQTTSLSEIKAHLKGKPFTSQESHTGQFLD
jgi:hypothetical protein